MKLLHNLITRRLQRRFGVHKYHFNRVIIGIIKPVDFAPWHKHRVALGHHHFRFTDSTNPFTRYNVNNLFCILMDMLFVGTYILNFLFPSGEPI